MAPPADRPARRPAVLLAEHEPEVAELARRYLARAGLDVTVAATPQETIAALTERPAAAAPVPVLAAAAAPVLAAAAAPVPALAVAVLDLTMPGLDARRLRGLLAARETPAAVARTPAIYLLGGTMRPRDVRAGADHCLHRPFSARLLVARVLSVLPSPERHTPRAPHVPRALKAPHAPHAPHTLKGPYAPKALSAPEDPSALGTTTAPAAPGAPLVLPTTKTIKTPGAAEAPGDAPVAPGLALDAATRRVRIGGRDITLTPAEFALLSALATHAGRVLTRDQLQAVMHRPGSARAVDVHVAQLRAKLPVPGPIRTVHGVGYVLDRPRQAPGRPGTGNMR